MLFQRAVEVLMMLNERVVCRNERDERCLMIEYDHHGGYPEARPSQDPPYM